MYKKALLHFKNSDTALHEASLKISKLTLSPHPDPFLRLCRSIVGQQLSVKAAQTIFERFEKLFKQKINSKELLEIPDEKLRGAGLSYQKVKYLKDLAAKTISGEIDLHDLNTKENEEIILELTKIKGIGVWTAEMFLMFSLGRTDVFSYGDLGLQNAIMKLYKLKQKPTVKQMEKLSKKWIPYRTFAAMILWRSLDNEPK
jgi:DNA-3-methyladenine glycosylase II